MPPSSSPHADAVHDTIDWVGQHIKYDGSQSERDQHNRNLADVCLEKMKREELSHVAIREVAHHVSEFSHVIGNRIRAQRPDIFATGEDINLCRAGASVKD